jgi:hypothetical protein
MVWISIWISHCRSPCTDICTAFVSSADGARDDVYEDMGLTLKPYNKPLNCVTATKSMAFTRTRFAHPLAERYIYKCPTFT